MMRQLRYPFADMMQHAAPNLIHRPSDGETKCVTVSRSVAFYDNSTQPQQTCAIVPPVIDPSFKCFDNRNRYEAGKSGEEIAPEFLAQESGKHLRNTL